MSVRPPHLCFRRTRCFRYLLAFVKLKTAWREPSMERVPVKPEFAKAIIAAPPAPSFV